MLWARKYGYFCSGSARALRRDTVCYPCTTEFWRAWKLEAVDQALCVDQAVLFESVSGAEGGEGPLAGPAWCTARRMNVSALSLRLRSDNVQTRLFSTATGSGWCATGWRSRTFPF